MTEEDESDKRISGWAGIMHDEFDFVKIYRVHMCTRLSLSDYMALGLMYVEHIFYIEPDLTTVQKVDFGRSLFFSHTYAPQHRKAPARKTRYSQHNNQ